MKWTLSQRRTENGGTAEWETVAVIEADGNLVDHIYCLLREDGKDEGYEYNYRAVE